MITDVRNLENLVSDEIGLKKLLFDIGLYLLALAPPHGMAGPALSCTLT
jgi:hypothetical protein